MRNRTYVRQLEMKVDDNTARMLYEVRYIKRFGDGYHNYPKDSYEFWKSIGFETDAFDFYSDGLRFSTSLEFS